MARSWAGSGVVFVVLTAFVSGLATFVNVYAVRGTGSDAFVTMRNLAVAAALVPVAFLAARYLRAPALRAVDWARLVAIGVIGGAVPFLLFFHGLALATASGGATTAAFGYRTLFLFASVFALVYLRERLHGRWLVAAGLLLAGNALLLSFSTAIWTDGTAYVLAATALWATEYTLSKKALADLPSPTVGAGRMGFGAVVLVGYLTVTAQWGSVAGFSGTDWAWVGLSAALLVAFVATFYAGLKRVDVSVAASVLVLGFPVTTLLGALVGSSPLSVGQALGVVVVVSGVGAAVGLTQLKDAGAFVARWLRPSAQPP